MSNRRARSASAWAEKPMAIETSTAPNPLDLLYEAPELAAFDLFDELAARDGGWQARRRPCTGRLHQDARHAIASSHPGVWPASRVLPRRLARRTELASTCTRGQGLAPLLRVLAESYDLDRDGEARRSNSHEQARAIAGTDRSCHRRCRRFARSRAGAPLGACGGGDAQGSLAGGPRLDVQSGGLTNPAYGYLGGMAPSGSLDLHVSDVHLAGERLAEAAISEATAGSREIEIERVVVEGDAGDVLVEAATEHDLLVVGSRGHGELADLLLGSVSQHCVHHAPCPVVVVRLSADGHSRSSSGSPGGRGMPWSA